MGKLTKHIDRALMKSKVNQVFRQAVGSPRREYKGPQISASLLSVRHPEELIPWTVAACHAGVERIHIDVISGDGRRTAIVQAEGARDTTQLFSPERLHLIKVAVYETGFQIPIDIHLMIEEPSEELLSSYLEVGADSIALHWEGLDSLNLVSRFKFIRSHSPLAHVVLAMGPDADIDAIGTFLNEVSEFVDMISLCAVTPGLGGLTFQCHVLGHLRRLRTRYGYAGSIQIDGGIEPKISAPMAREAGADILVAGTALFGQSNDRRPNIKRLRTAYLSLQGGNILGVRTHASDRPISRASDTHLPLFLECLNCQKREPASRVLKACPACGGNLEFAAAKHMNFIESITERPDLWRYQNLMPVPQKQIISSCEGYTPVILLEDSSKHLGITLYAKLESENPTGTFKDREASFVISRYRMAGKDNLVMQSTGNTGLAITYYAGLAGLNSFFFAPACSAYKLIAPPKQSYNKIILVKGHPIDVKNYAKRFSERHNFPKISPFHERSEANATQAYEVGEVILRGQMPNIDFYVQTIAAGMGPIGFYEGMERLVHWTNSQVTLPRIIAVQISEFAPAQKAWEQNLEELGLEAQMPTYSSEKPFEPTLHTTNAPAYYPYLRRALKATRGILTAVKPEVVCSYEKELRASLFKHGYVLADTERSSFIGYAGLVEQIENGTIPLGSNVLLMVTGKGVKSNFGPIEPDAIIRLSYDPDRLLKQLRSGEIVRDD